MQTFPNRYFFLKKKKTQLANQNSMKKIMQLKLNQFFGGDCEYSTEGREQKTNETEFKIIWHYKVETKL